MPTRPRRAAAACAALLTATIGVAALVSPARAVTPDRALTNPADTRRSVADTVPPTRPGLTVALDISLTWATMSVLHPSSDDTAVAGYAAQREIDGVWTDV